MPDEELTEVLLFEFKGAFSETNIAIEVTEISKEEVEVIAHGRNLGLIYRYSGWGRVQSMDELTSFTEEDLKNVLGWNNEKTT